MASIGISGIQRRKATFSLAALLLLVSLLALALIISGIPAAHADGPVLTVSSGTTNPGGEVEVTGTGWAPATHYNLYVYGQAKCKPDPICLPPSPSDTYLINSKPQPIDKNGDFGPFHFSFRDTAKAANYVFTVIADAPAGSPYTASVIVQVVPAGTPPSGVPVSSSPTVTATAQPTKAPTTPTTANQGTGGTGGQNNSSSGGSNTLAIIVVTILLIIAVAVLIGLLIVLPPKRRAIRAAWYGAGSPGVSGGYSRYGASGPMAPTPRRPSSGYVPGGQPEPPTWMGGVAQWDDPPRSPRSSSRPRRPQGGDY